jgi:two-component system, OmpR family, alkaline phosphatase synthesis response regulator PhoP
MADKILIVEDSEFLARIYKAKLEKLSFKVKLAFDVEKGLKILKTFMPNLIMLDVGLPKKSGFDFLEVVRQDEQMKKVPVIMLTSKGDKDNFDKGMALGATEYLCKSNVSFDEVLEKIGKHIQGKTKLELKRYLKELLPNVG